MSDDQDSKYITFKREDFERHIYGLETPPYTQYELYDAVVIRRQDLFASPCLATYANMIALVAKNISDADQAKQLLLIADYFEHQAQLAAEEGFKLPDL